MKPLPRPSLARVALREIRFFRGDRAGDLLVIIVPLIAFAVLAVALASLVAAGMPLLTALTGVGVSVLALHGLSAALSVSDTAVTLAVMIGLAVGVDYALFILSRHRAQLATGLTPAESAATAVATMVGLSAGAAAPPSTAKKVFLMARWTEMPLAELPREELRKALALYREPIDLLHRAARSEHCDFEIAQRLREKGIAASLPFWQQSWFTGPVAAAHPQLGDVSYFVAFAVAFALASVPAKGSSRPATQTAA